MQRELQKLNWLTVQKLVPGTIDTVLLPVGTVEAHGSACLGTDNFIPEVICTGICERLNALIAPTVNHGITRSLYRYPGSTTVKPESFGNYLHDLLESFHASKFKNVFIMNGHGGNNSVLKQVALDFHHQRQVNIAVVHWWELCERVTQEVFGHAGGHAGTDETAIVYSIDKSYVDQSAFSPELAYTFVPGADIYPVPGTILLYKQGEGLPEFDSKKAMEYRNKVIETVGTFCTDVVARWRRAGLA